MSPLENAARNLVRQDYYRHGHQPSGAVEGYVDSEWPARLDDARAVLQAIRDPSQAMVQAKLGDRNLPIYPEDIWRAMIDAALQEG